MVRMGRLKEALKYGLTKSKFNIAKYIEIKQVIIILHFSSV